MAASSVPVLPPRADEAVQPRSYAPAVLTASVLAGVLAVVIGGLTTGVFDPSLIADPGPLVRWSLPVVGLLAELATSVTVGGLVAATFLLRPGRDRDRALVVAGAAAGAWTLLALADLVLTFADVLGDRPGEAAFGNQLAQFVTQVPLGRILLVVVLLAALVSVLALLVRTPTGAAWCLALVATCLALRSLTGHTAGAAGHDIAVSSMMLHLVGAAAWVGGILVLIALRLRGGLRSPALAEVVARFSTLAAWCLVIVAYSGVLSAVVRLASPADLLGTRYGLLVVGKIVLLLALGGLGWLHRARVVRRLGNESDGRTARRLFWRLMAAEAVLMGAVAGVAGALGASAPPVPDRPPVAPSPAEIVTGEMLPPEPTVLRWLTEWRWEPILGLLVVAASVVYVRWAVRLRRRGDGWPVARVLAWLVAMAVLLWVTCGGAAVYGRVLFSGHMVQHMTMAMVAPLFLTMSAPMTLALRALPARKDGSRGPREWLLTIVHSRYGRFFAHPIVAAVNFAGSMIVFYWTPLFEWSLTTHVGHLGMVAHFTLAGYFFANALVGIDPGPQRPGYPLRLLLLLVTMAFHAFFGVALMSSTALLVPEWFGLMGRPWGRSAIDDQQIGGGVAWGLGEIPTMLLAVVVGFRWARDDERVARRRDRRVDASGEDAELDAYNAMLSGLAVRHGAGAGHTGADDGSGPRVSDTEVDRHPSSGG